jgi:hypothetical protein
MFNSIRQIILAKKMGSLTRLATKIIYSEQFDLEKCIERLSSVGNGASSLRVYMAIQTAASVT